MDLTEDADHLNCPQFESESTWSVVRSLLPAPLSLGAHAGWLRNTECSVTCAHSGACSTLTQQQERFHLTLPTKENRNLLFAVKDELWRAAPDSSIAMTISGRHPWLRAEKLSACLLSQDRNLWAQDRGPAGTP